MEPMSRGMVVAGALVGVLVVGGAAGGVVWKQQQDAQAADAAARGAASDFAHAWSSRSLDTAAYAGRSPQAVAKDFASATAALGKAPVTVRVTSLSRQDHTATARLSVAWTLPGGTTWSYTDPVRLSERGATWAVDTPSAPGPSLWHPKLPAGGAFGVERTTGARGDVIGGDGKALMTATTVHDIAIDPVQSDEATVTALEQVVGFPPGSLVAKLRQAKKSGSRAPIPVITYRESDYQQRAGRLESLPGVLDTPRKQPLARTRTFGQPLLGGFGEVTKEVVDRSGGRYAAGDHAGTSGLQSQYDRYLAGGTGLVVTVKGKPKDVLFRKRATDGKPLKLTLNADVQEAAEHALAGTGGTPSALVAVDVRTGGLLAVANSPSYGIDRALTGHYQPGSTLKVATSYSLLTHGLSPDQTVTCPKATTVDGLKVTNYANESFGDIPFAMDFAHSCNTAFADLSKTMGDADLHQAANALGIGRDWHLGVDGTYSGSVPVASGATDKAASAFGQARTLASPAAMAVMAASVARGSYIEPSLVTSPEPKGADQTPEPLDPKATSELQHLMRLVVTKGTGTPLLDVPGAPVHAKTGTAEHNGPKPRAWMVGWQGNVAFAVLVEQGTSGEVTAGPVAKAFLTGLH